MYNLTLNFNGETFTKTLKSKSPTTIKKEILSLKPLVLLTEMYLTLQSGEDVRERKLNLLQGKKLFNDNDFLTVFTLNLLLK